jgi:hypothetical protein
MTINSILSGFFHNKKSKTLGDIHEKNTSFTRSL